MADLMFILQRLYDSEINFEVSGFYDAGFDVRLNGFLAKGKAEPWGCHSWQVFLWRAYSQPSAVEL
jgi:hypothetical protein